MIRIAHAGAVVLALLAGRGAYADESPQPAPADYGTPPACLPAHPTVRWQIPQLAERPLPLAFDETALAEAAEVPTDGEAPSSPPPVPGTEPPAPGQTPPPATPEGPPAQIPAYTKTEYQGATHGCYRPNECIHKARLSNKVLPLADLPCRPRALLEIGDPFMHPGRLSRGIQLNTCQVIQPGFMVHGSFRTGVVALGRSGDEIVQWANRLDLFGNIRISATERIVLGINPLDLKGDFTGFAFHPDAEFTNGANADFHTYFFEGDFGEIFPTLDRADRHPLDIGFSVGRQPFLLQDGILVADNMDSIGITQNSLRPDGMSNLQITALFAWNLIHRSPLNIQDKNAVLFGVNVEGDFPERTMDLTVLRVASSGADDGSGMFVGLGNIQRIGKVNSTVRVNASIPTSDETFSMGLGGLVTGEFSYSPVATDDLVYANVFTAIGEFSIAARTPGTGGPLGRMGILWSRPAIGNHGSVINNVGQNAFGGAVGWQRFFDDGRRQLVFEIGGRESTNDSSKATVAGGARYQMAVGQHTVLLFDAFAGWRETDGAFVGGRFEYLFKF